MGVLYGILLTGMVTVIWLITPSSYPKVLIEGAAVTALCGRVYLEVRLRHSSWGKVLRLARHEDHSGGKQQADE